MWIALDVGNTHTVVGCFDGLKLLQTFRIATHSHDTPDELRMKLGLLSQSVLSANRGPHPDRAAAWNPHTVLEQVEALVIASVVPEFTQTIERAFAPYLFRQEASGTKVFKIDHSWPFSFAIRPQPPRQVGADILVNSEASIRKWDQSCIILDCGTATTLSAVIKDPEKGFIYLGSAIMPGVETAFSSLIQRTAQLFSVELCPPQSSIGSNTSEALQSGMVFGYSAMLNGMIERFKKELDLESAPVIATGGLSYWLRPLVPAITHEDPDLTLYGIAYSYERIQRKSQPSNSAAS